MGSTSDSESLRIAKGYLNHGGLVLWVYRYFFCNYAVQRGNGYDLLDNADQYRSGRRADVAVVDYWCLKEKSEHI